MTELDSQELTVEDAKRQRVRARGLLLKLAGIAALLAIWQAGVTFLDVPTYILPTPMQVWAALESGLFVPLDSPTGFYIPIASTLANAAMGFVIGSILGLLIGSLMAEFRSVETVLMPYAFALQTLPKVAIRSEERRVGREGST